VTDPRDQKWESRGDRAYTYATDHPFRLGAWFVGALIALSIFGGILGLIGDWGSETKKLVGPQHSKEQITAVLDDWESMKVAAQNACQVQEAGTKKDDRDPLIIESPSLAYDATYRRIEVDYNRRMGNFFEAYVTRKIPLPGSIKDLPQRAPTLVEVKTEAGC
jgi:hypothetical protein